LCTSWASARRRSSSIVAPFVVGAVELRGLFGVLGGTIRAQLGGGSDHRTVCRLVPSCTFA
jgi:hypothetical protein